MVSTRPLVSKFSSPFNNPLMTVLKAPITIGIIVKFMFHNFVNSIAMSRDLSFFLFSFSFIQLAETAKSTILQVLLFFLIIIRSGLLGKIRWSVCMSKSHRSLCVSFPKTDDGLCIYHLFIWSNLNFLNISRWIILPTQSCLLLLLLLFTPLEFFTSVLADGFSLEFEWQQVSSSLQDLSQYSGRPQQCCRLDSLYPSANFQAIQAL